MFGESKVEFFWWRPSQSLILDQHGSQSLPCTIKQKVLVENGGFFMKKNPQSIGLISISLELQQGPRSLSRHPLIFLIIITQKILKSINTKWRIKQISLCRWLLSSYYPIEYLSELTEQIRSLLIETYCFSLRRLWKENVSKTATLRGNGRIELPM